MPTVRCEIARTGDTFLVRFFDNGHPYPVDTYECHKLVADWAVLDAITDSLTPKEEDENG